MSNSKSTSPIPPANRHALTAVEKQRSQLEKLLKDPAKPAYIPPPPKEKTIRPAREMMKNVQGSSAGAGSGEFHVYKASRRREYERLKILEEEAHKEKETVEFERRRREAEEVANAKTTKNRAKRQKKKELKKKGGTKDTTIRNESNKTELDLPLKKRRLVNGEELIFKKPGVESEEGESDQEQDTPAFEPSYEETSTTQSQAATAETARIVIFEDD